MKRREVRGIAVAVAFLVAAALACGPGGGGGGAPSVTITSPPSGTTVMVGEEVQIVSTAAADAGVERVELSVNGQLVRSDTPPSGNPTTFSVAQPWVPVAEGEVTVSVVVYDLEGVASEPAVINLRVEAAVAGVTPTPEEDVEGPGGCTLNAAFVADVTVPDDTEFAPGESFVKTWRLRNTGTCDWGPGFSLVFVDGDAMGGPSSVDVPPTAAGSTADVSVNFTAPNTPGTYRSDWRMQSDTGLIFGSVVYVRIVVPEPTTEAPTPTEEPTEEPTEGPTPAPPSNLVATVHSDGRVTFAWEDAVGEAEYRYEFSFVAGGLGAATTDVLPADTTSWDGGVLDCGGEGGFTIIALAEDGSEIGRISVSFNSPPCATPETEQVGNQATVAAGSGGSATASCPSGTVVTGGGFASRSDRSLYVYTHSQDGNGWRVYGWNSSGGGLPLNAYAICLSNSGGSTTQVYNQVSVPAGGVGHAEVSCPAGSVVTGGGYASNHDQTLYVYNSSRSGNGWQVYAHNMSGSSRLLNVYAICLSGTSASSTQVLQQISVAANSTGHAIASCPAGSIVTGGGFAGSDELYVYTTAKEENGWEAYARNSSGISRLLNVYAICLSFP